VAGVKECGYPLEERGNKVGKGGISGEGWIFWLRDFWEQRDCSLVLGLYSLLNLEIFNILLFPLFSLLFYVYT